MDFIMKNQSGEVGRIEIDTFYNTWEVAMIHVALDHRGKGYGNVLLKMACSYADLNEKDLELVTASTGPMTNEQLGEWYGRHGFVRLGMAMRRHMYKPKENWNVKQETVPHKVP